MQRWALGWIRKPMGGGWTLREIDQGKPLGHPSHALFIHFPAGLWPAALLLDSWIHPDPTLARAAPYDLLLGLALAVPPSSPACWISSPRSQVPASAGWGGGI